LFEGDGRKNRHDELREKLDLKLITQGTFKIIINFNLAVDIAKQ